MPLVCNLKTSHLKQNIWKPPFLWCVFNINKKLKIAVYVHIVAYMDPDEMSHMCALMCQCSRRHINAVQRKPCIYPCMTMDKLWGGFEADTPPNPYCLQWFMLYDQFIWKWFQFHGSPFITVKSDFHTDVFLQSPQTFVRITVLIFHYSLSKGKKELRSTYEAATHRLLHWVTRHKWARKWL